MAFDKTLNWSFKHSEQGDKLYDVFTSAQIKEKFDSRGVDLKAYVDKFIDYLQSADGLSAIGLATNTLSQQLSDITSGAIQSVAYDNPTGKITFTMKDNSTKVVNISSLRGMTEEEQDAFTDLGDDVSDLQDDVSSLQTSVSTNTTNIASLTSQLAAIAQTGVSPDASLINDTTPTAVNTYSSSKIESLIANCATASNEVEPALMDIPRIYLSSVNGSTLPSSKTATTMKFKYVSKTKQIDGYVDIKCQGNSSMAYAKKNFTIKLYSDQAKTTKQKVDFKGWDKQSKFVLKANWIDITHSLNIVSARLWGQIIKSRTGYNNMPELLRTSPNQGAVDGFPVMLYNCGKYWGRYTLNIPKDAWMTNMDDSLSTHCILCGENYDSGCFRSTASINGSDWTDELHDTVPASIVTRWNQAITAVKDSTDANFIANLNNYIDVESAIDYYIFALVSCGLDSMGKNQLYLTYDGQKWYADMYDMDSTWGLYWDGSKFVSSSYKMQDNYESMVSNRQGNLLYLRLESLFMEQIKTRYASLRNGVLSAENIINEFEKFWDICPNDLLAEDYASTTGGGSFTGIPSKTSNTKQRIRAFIVDRLTYCDTYINSLVVPVSCTGLTLSASTLTFTNATSQTLTATITPSNTTDTLTWVSSDETKATVNGGVITPVANGSCTITATCGSQTATCTVTISGIVANYSITNTLSHCTNSNTDTSVQKGASYSGTLTADFLYALGSITVTMGGTDITSSAVSGSTISISSVTGNIVITCNAGISSETPEGYIKMNFADYKGFVTKASTTNDTFNGYESSQTYTALDYPTSTTALDNKLYGITYDAVTDAAKVNYTENCVAAVKVSNSVFTAIKIKKTDMTGYTDIYAYLHDHPVYVYWKLISGYKTYNVETDVSYSVANWGQVSNDYMKFEYPISADENITSTMIGGFTDDAVFTSNVDGNRNVTTPVNVYSYAWNGNIYIGLVIAKSLLTSEDEAGVKAYINAHPITIYY